MPAGSRPIAEFEVAGLSRRSVWIVGMLDVLGRIQVLAGAIRSGLMTRRGREMRSGSMRGPDDGATRHGSRNRYADLLRISAVVLVVLGHWLATSITYSGEKVSGQDLLNEMPWTQWLTLVFQVMPVFFLVGGLANATSWTSQRLAGVDWSGWVYRRAVRLLVPTSVYAAVAVVGVMICRVLAVRPGVLAPAAWAIAFHLWFLPVYLSLLVATPLLHAAHGRWGLRVPAVMAIGTVAVDLVVLGLHPPLLGWANYVLVWGAVHQLGFAWHDATLTRDRRLPLTLAATGITVMVALVWLGPFPVSMIGVTGARIKNTAPPSIALLSYAVGQVGLLLAVEPTVMQWLYRPQVWRVVAWANRMAMTLYLWHMVPVVVVALAVYPTGLFPATPIGSPTWWLLRGAWVAALTAVFIPLTLALRRLEPNPPARQQLVTGRWPAWSGVLLVGGSALAALALARTAVVGFAPDGRLDIPTLGAFAAGVLLVITAGNPHVRHAGPIP